MPAVLANPKNANEISFEQRARDLKDQEQKLINSSFEAIFCLNSSYISI